MRTMSIPDSATLRRRVPSCSIGRAIGKSAASGGGSAQAQPAAIAITPAMEPQDGACMAGPLCVATLRHLRQVNKFVTVAERGRASAPRCQLTGSARQEGTQSRPQLSFAGKIGRCVEPMTALDSHWLLRRLEMPNMRTYQLAAAVALAVVAGPAQAAPLPVWTGAKLAGQMTSGGVGVILTVADLCERA